MAAEQYDTLIKLSTLERLNLTFMAGTRDEKKRLFGHWQASDEDLTPLGFVVTYSSELHGHAGHRKWIKPILDSGVDVNAVVNYHTGETAAHIAIRHNDATTFQILLGEYNARTDIQDSNGITVMDLLLKQDKQCPETSRKIPTSVTNETDVNSIVNSETGETALHIALKDCDAKTADKLLSLGADLSLKDSEGNTGVDAYFNGANHAPVSAATATFETFASMIDINPERPTQYRIIHAVRAPEANNDIVHRKAAAFAALHDISYEGALEFQHNLRRAEKHILQGDTNTTHVDKVQQPGMENKGPYR